MTEITIPASVTRLDYASFKACTSLAKVVFEDSCKPILGYAVFLDCTSLESVTMPEGITNITYNCFENTKLSDIRVACNSHAYNWAIEKGYTPTIYRHQQVVTDAAFEPTCTEDGATEGSHCESCGEVFVAQETIPALGHSPLTLDEGIPATCTEAGVEPTILCEVCGELLSEGNEIPPLDHAWGPPTFHWSEDILHSTVSFTCERCEESTEVEASIRTESTTPATCTEDGKREVTMYVILDDWEYTADEMIILPATGHSVVVDEAVTPTDRETGLTEGSHCAVCGEVLVAQEVIPALWSYSEDGLTVTAYNGSATDLTIPDGVTALTGMLFKNNTSITSIRVPDSVTDLGTQSFFGATSLTKVWLPDHLSNLTAVTFYGVNATFYANPGSDTAKMLSLRAKTFTEEATGNVYQYKLTSLASVTGIRIVSIPDMEETELVIPEEIGGAAVIEIMSRAYADHESLTRVEIPDSVKTIAEDAFLADVTILSAHDAYARTWADEHGYIWEHAHHVETVLAGKEPTCEENGLTEGVICELCDTVLKEQEVLPALGHAWAEPAYTWSEGRASVTAIRICSHDENHVETETVAVTSEVTAPATCEEMGQTTYTSAAFENEAFAVQVEVLTDLPAIGHAWTDPVYTWSEDKTSVSAYSVCQHDDSHVHEETVAAQCIVTVSPTQSSEGSYKYVSAAFVFEGFEAQEQAGIIPALSTLSTPIFPVNLTIIEEEAFAGTSFQAVLIPESVTAIGTRAFADCPNLIYVRIPASVTTLAPDAFADCNTGLIVELD